MPCGETTSRLTASRTPLSSSGCILPASSDAKLASSLGSDARLARWTPRRRRTSVLVLDCVLRMATLSLILVHNTSQHSRSSPMSKTTKSTHTHAHNQPHTPRLACPIVLRNNKQYHVTHRCAVVAVSCRAAHPNVCTQVGMRVGQPRCKGIPCRGRRISLPPRLPQLWHEPAAGWFAHQSISVLEPCERQLRQQHKENGSVWRGEGVAMLILMLLS